MSTASTWQRYFVTSIAVLGLLMAILSTTSNAEESTKGDVSAAHPQSAAMHDAGVVQDVPKEGMENLASEVQAADIVAEVVLTKAKPHVPEPLRIIVTDYVFQVSEGIKGPADLKTLTVRNAGGELPQGLGMEATTSYKLKEGERYLVFVRKGPSGFRFANVYQISRDGAVVADANGRIVVGVTSGNFVKQRDRAMRPLSYRIPIRGVEPRLQGPPDTGSHPVSPGVAPTTREKLAPMSLDQVKSALKATLKEGSVIDVPGNPKEPGTDVGGFLPRAILDGGYVSESINFYCLLPTNNQWDWFQACEANWNRLVGTSSSGRNWLFGYMTRNNAPIRNENPKANNGRNNLGITTDAQMTAGGYDTWTSLRANGVCYRWYTTTNGRIKEVDVLVNASLASNEAQFRKSLTHELGHALTLGHEDRYMALMYPGTWRQPPNYSSWWYARSDDFIGARSMLRWVNTNIDANRWKILTFTDIATWSQAHQNPGRSGSLVMTNLSANSVNRGQRVTFRNVHVENRGNNAGKNVTLKFYVSWNPTISNKDTEIASYTWSTFQPESYWTGPLDATIPRSVNPGTYYVGWVLTTNSPEITDSNNTTILRRDASSNFAPQTVTIR